MHKKILETKIVAFLLSVTLVACDKKKEDLVNEIADNASQIVSTTTTTTLPEATTTTTVPSVTTTTTLPVITTTTTTLPVTTTTTTTLPVSTTTTTTTLPVTTTTTSTTTTTLPPVTTTTTTSTTTTTTTLPPTVGFDLFKDVAYVVGGDVDKIYSSHRDLLVQRGSNSVHQTDSCDINLNTRSTFADRIAYYTYVNTVPRKAQIGLVASLFAVNSDMSKLVATSLISNPMCTVSKDTLTKTIGKDRVPSSSVIRQMNLLAKRYNTLRAKILEGNTKTAILDMNKLLSRMNMCLAYVESLTTADTSTSDKMAQKYAPVDYHRPSGVLFHEDLTQSARVDVGLFQFAPDAIGNVHTCIKQWNVIYPSCSIPADASNAELIRILGSSYQSFNAFCGTEKPSEMFAVQINTTDAQRTHPANLVSGKLKDPTSRCVSLHFSSELAYNHFGPFQNSTGNNLKELLTCTLAP